MKQKSKKQLRKQLIREAAQAASVARKARKKAYRQSEMALLKATPILRFHGRLIMEPREHAILAAITLSQYHEEDQLIYFADGAVDLAQKNVCSQDTPKEKRRRKFNLAAAVAHKASEASDWRLVSFSVPQSGKKYYLEAEMSGIAGALGVAISDISVGSSDHSHDGYPASRAIASTVVILTDCQAALSELQKLQNVSYTEKQLEGNAVARRIITRSQYLQRVGVHLEIRWVPGHAGIQGNCYADAAARAMASSGASCEEEETIGLVTYDECRNGREITGKHHSAVGADITSRNYSESRQTPAILAFI